MTTQPLTENQTKFAVAARLTPGDIARQHAQCADLDILQVLLDTLSDVVVVLNPQRQVVLSNQALLQMTGKTHQQEVLGQRMGELIGCTHADEEPGGCGTAAACSQCGAVRVFLKGMAGQNSTEDARILQQSGDALDLRVSARLIMVDEDEFVLIDIKDISDEKRRRLLERTFFHDVLNTAGGLLLLNDIPPDDYEDFMREHRSLSTRLVEEIKAFKQLTAAESGDLEVDRMLISANHTLRELYQNYHALATQQEKALVIETQLQDEILESDPLLLGRVLGNMVKNALEATDPGARVTLGYTVEGRRVRFWVHNPGYIPTRIQHQIFQRSFSTKGHDRGLGTYSMKLLTERYLGGEVTFTTSYEDGTRFSAALPLG